MTRSPAGPDEDGEVADCGEDSSVAGGVTAFADELEPVGGLTASAEGLGAVDDEGAVDVATVVVAAGPAEDLHEASTRHPHITVAARARRCNVTMGRPLSECASSAAIRQRQAGSTLHTSVMPVSQSFPRLAAT